MLWRACDQPSTIVLPNCQEASQRQQLLLSRHLSPSSITLIKCSSSHSVIDKASQWLDQGPIKKKRSWPCTTWRYTGGHCASKSCNWESPSLPPLRKRVWLLILCLCEKKGWFFPKKKDEFSQRYLDHFWHLNSDARVSRSSWNQIFFRWLSTNPSAKIWKSISQPKLQLMLQS